MKLEETTFKDDKVFNVYFDNLTDLHDYLASNPKVYFKDQSSLAKDKDFYGEPLKKSIEYLLGSYNEGKDEFIKISNKLNKTGFAISEEIIQSRGLFGGIPLAPLVAAGVPDCMLRYEREQNLRVINVYYNLGYSHYITTKQILNRGLATIALIQALEKKGYIVNFYAYELSYSCDEIVNIQINLKNASDLFFNIEKCYYPIKAKEFLRRILFRVLESQPVSDHWQYGYGAPCRINYVKQFFNIKGDSIVIGTPDEMGIEGYDVYEDTKTLIKKLNYQDEFDLRKIKNDNLNKQKEC